ncbi:MAG TPA: hypothetical protein EYG98_03465 [Sulfurovum sp.]|nr:hypothetical protein [Sulfurovum sp.]
MAKNKEKTYWPHMILGFLFFGIMLGYWTIKSAINMPVNKSNGYQMEYQMADMNINDILEAQERFDSKYSIKAIDFKKSSFKPNEFLKRKHGEIIELLKNNKISYEIRTLSGEAVNDAKVTFLLTRPHSRDDDQKFELAQGTNGIYTIPEVVLTNPGRYTLRLRAQKGDDVSFLDHEAYLQP